jgi:predicted transcriptional regulator of viral defense system
MSYLHQPYYVGLLSAAAIQGAAHQQPMAFQVMTSKPTRPTVTGRVRIRFFTNRLIDQMPVTEAQTETGTMRISTPEVTAFDLVRYPQGAGHLSNTAMVLSELAESIEAEALVAVARRVRIPEVQRLGYLLDLVGEGRIAKPLAAWLRDRRPRTILLRPDGPPNGGRDPRWNVVPNEKLALDL